MAHRLQQGERVLRAEQLTMKVRYESKLGKLQKDYSKMLSTAERLQKERDLHRDIIKGIQKGMSQLKANYTADVAHWQDDKAVLERQIHEVSSTRQGGVRTSNSRGRQHTTILW